MRSEKSTFLPASRIVEPIDHLPISIERLLSIFRGYPAPDTSFLPTEPTFRLFAASCITAQFHSVVYISLQKSGLLYTGAPVPSSWEKDVLRFAYASVRIDLTDLVDVERGVKGPDAVEDSVKKFLNAAIKESRVIPQNPFRVCVRVDATDAYNIYRYEEHPYISEIILTGTLPKNFKNPDLRHINMDISRVTLPDFEILRTMQFKRTKINREQFLYMLRNNFIKSKLAENGASIDLSFADISHTDLTSIPPNAKIQLYAYQDLRGCTITTAQANAWKKAGIKTLASATIVKDKYADKELSGVVITPNRKSRINATALETLFEKGRLNEVELDHYEMALNDLKIILKKLCTGHSLFCARERNDQLPTFLQFLQTQIKKHKIKEIILSNMHIQDIDFTDFNFDHIVMQNCTFHNVNFKKTHCEQAQFQDCKFQYCDFNEVHISPNTVFKDPDFTFADDAKIDRIYYQKDKKYIALNPVDYYYSVKYNHGELLVQKRKSPWAHRFFKKTDSKVANPHKSLLAKIFASFLQTLLGLPNAVAAPMKASQGFEATICVEAHRKKNRGGMTNMAAENYLRGQEKNCVNNF